MILLTEAETGVIVQDLRDSMKPYHPSEGQEREGIAKAQLKKVVGWLFSECEDDEHEHGYSDCEFSHYECTDCRQAILKECE